VQSPAKRGFAGLSIPNANMMRAASITKEQEDRAAAYHRAAGLGDRIGSPRRFERGVTLGSQMSLCVTTFGINYRFGGGPTAASLVGAKY
jgi:hypothetical protein